MNSLRFHDKLSGISPYIVDKVKYDIKLDANESFLSFPSELEEELVESIKELMFNRYPDAEAETVCNLYALYCGCKRENIIAGNGSDELIQIVVNAFLGKDDKVQTLKPDFSMYKYYSSIIGGKIVEFALEEDFKLNVEKFIETAKVEEVKIIIFSNPNNPTGGIIPRRQIEEIVKRCSNALIVVDEAYYEFYGESVLDLIDKYDNLAVLRTCSKAMGIAAARLGFLISSSETVKNIKKVKPPFNVNSLTQTVGEIILKERELIRNNVEKICIERNFLIEKLRHNVEKFFGSDSIMYPSHANFIYIKTPIAEQLVKYLAGRGIIIRYFNNGAIRITAGNRSENEGLLKVLKEFSEEKGEKEASVDEL